MEEHVMNRRRVLLGAGAASAVAIGGVTSASSASASGDGSSDLSGSWIVTRKDDPPGDPTTVSTVASFAGGGVLISPDIAPAGPPGTGTWARRSGGGFKGTFWTGLAGGPGGPGVSVRVRIRGSVHHGRIWGTYSFTVFDATGAQVDSGTGSFSGRRIEP